MAWAPPIMKACKTSPCSRYLTRSWMPSSWIWIESSHLKTRTSSCRGNRCSSSFVVYCLLADTDKRTSRLENGCWSSLILYQMNFDLICHCKVSPAISARMRPEAVCSAAFCLYFINGDQSGSICTNTFSNVSFMYIRQFGSTIHNYSNPALNSLFPNSNK